MNNFLLPENKTNIITPRKMQQLDLLAQSKYGILSLILMENAGRSAAEIVFEMLLGKNEDVVCVCGRGNNGGDGLVCSRHLINRGVKVKIFMIAGNKPLKGDAKVNENILKKMGYRINIIDSSKNNRLLKQSLGKCSMVIDAIFGIGFKGQMRDDQAGIIQVINQSGKPVVSLDIPSGLDALSGKVSGACIKADATVTFGFSKTGLIKNHGPLYAGKVIVADISLPRNFYTG
ncbi:MAG: NAD(P)H-hydrate epimerase [Candidatus Omnitrophota bacterium]|jgi:NAD(P)H-hydrate epimerase